MNTDRLYFSELDNESNKLFDMLNCVEKIKYYILRDYVGTDRWGYFCGDINLQFNYERCSFTVGDIFMGEDIFDVKLIKPDQHERLCTIEKLLIENGIVGVQTRFELLDCFIWQPEDGPHTGHVMAIINQDDEYFYFVESLEILERSVQTKIYYNQDVRKISKREIEKALQYFCNIYVFSLNECLLSKYNTKNRINDLLRECVEKYYMSSIYGVGKKAYVEMLISMKQQFNERWKENFNTHWYAHLMLSRRRILYRNMEKNNMFERAEKLRMALGDSITAWNEFKMLIMKNNKTEIDKFRERCISCYENIIIKDDILFQAIKDYVDCETI